MKLLPMLQVIAMRITVFLVLFQQLIKHNVSPHVLPIGSTIVSVDFVSSFVSNQPTHYYQIPDGVSGMCYRITCKINMYTRRRAVLLESIAISNILHHFLHQSLFPLISSQ